MVAPLWPARKDRKGLPDPRSKILPAYKEVDALNNPHRERSGVRHSGPACCRDRRAGEGLEEVARNPADALLADY